MACCACSSGVGSMGSMSIIFLYMSWEREGGGREGGKEGGGGREGEGRNDEQKVNTKNIQKGGHASSEVDKSIPLPSITHHVHILLPMCCILSSSLYYYIYIRAAKYCAHTQHKELHVHSKEDHIQAG